MTMKVKVLDSIKWMFLAQLVSQLFRTGVTLFVIRQLNSEGMAVVALSQAVIGFLEMFSTLGMTSVIISKPDLTKKDIQSIHGLILLINLIIAGSILLASNVIAEFYGKPDLKPLLQVLSAAFIIGAIGSTSGAMLAREMKFRAISIIQVVAGVSGALTSFYCVTHGFDYWSIIIGGLMVQFVSMLMRLLICGQWLWPIISWSSSKEHISIGTYLMFSGIAWYLYVSLDVVLAGRFWTAESLGYYAVAMQLAVMPLSRLLPLLKGVALPAFSRTLVEDTLKLENYLLKSLRLSMSIVFPIYFGIASVALVLVPVLLGEKWVPVTWPLIFLCLSAPFRFFLEIQGPAIIATGHQKKQFKYYFSTLVIMLAAFTAVVVLSDNPSALALVWMTVYPPIVVFVTYKYARLLHIDFAALLKSSLPPFIASLVMLVVVMTYTLQFEASGNEVFLVVSSIILGAVVYSSALGLLDRRIFYEFRGLLKK